MARGRMGKGIVFRGRPVEPGEILDDCTPAETRLLVQVWRDGELVPDAPTPETVQAAVPVDEHRDPAGKRGRR